MILTAHQPVYLPWLGLFHKIALADQFVSFNQVQYQPKDWNNRNRIKTTNDIIWLSVPVLRKNYLEKTISEIEINNNVPWGRKHWKTLVLNYGKAPYFSEYADYFEEIYNKEWKTLVELNETMLRWFLKTLGINVAMHLAGDFNFVGEKSDLVLNMCLELNADTYIFGAQGEDYADVESFCNAGVKPIFQDYQHPEYSQNNGDFSSHLGIIDLLFNCGPDSLEILMSGNTNKVMLKAAGI
jgi:hypothetical protein